jgi:hypothetical protein
MFSVAESILRGIAVLAADASPVVDGTPTPGPAATPTALPPLPTPTAVAATSPWAPTQWLHTTGWTPNFHTIFLVFYILLAIGAVVAYFVFFQRQFKDHKVNAKLAERVSIVLTVFATIGLLLLLFAAGRISLLSMPLWLLLSTIAFLAFIIYGVYYYVSVYPAEIATYKREQERARYLPKPKGKQPAYVSPAKRKGKSSAKPASQQPGSQSKPTAEGNSSQAKKPK